MKFLAILLAPVIVIFTLTGCNTVDINDGQIPNELLSKVTPYLGEYSGKFNGRSGKVLVSLEGNMPKLVFIDAANGTTDLFGGQCLNSSIGKLLSVGSRSMTFEFDPGTCAGVIVGRQMNFYPRISGNVIKVDVEIRRTLEAKCPARDWEFCVGEESKYAWFAGHFEKLRE